MASDVVISGSERSASTLRVTRRFSWQIPALVLIVLLFGLVRWRLAQMPLERDEGEYAYAGQLMLQHIPPYKFAYNMKLPGTYAAYAGLMAIFGESPWGIHIGVLLINALNDCTRFTFLRTRLFGSDGGMVAAATYGLLSTHQRTRASRGTLHILWSSSPHAGLILLLRAIERDRTVLFFLSGLLFGLAFLMKQPGVFFGVFGFAYILFRLPAPSGGRLGPSSPKSFGDFSGRDALFPSLLLFLILWRAGVFPSFWFWTFSYARQYSSLISLKDGWGLFTFNFLPLFYCSLRIVDHCRHRIDGLYMASAVPTTCRFHSRTAGVFVFSREFRTIFPHSLFHHAAAGDIALLVATSRRLRREFAAGESSQTVAAGSPAHRFPYWDAAGRWSRNANFYFRMTPNQACHEAYGTLRLSKPFQSPNIYSSILSATDRLAVLGSEPEIFFYSHRLSSTGYIYVYALMENQLYWQKMQRQMIDEIESNLPHTSYLPISQAPG